MRDRLGKFALSLHPDKTRLIEFGRFAATDRKLRGLGKPETFTFSGFTFICGLSRCGNFRLQRKTRLDRMLGKLFPTKESERLPPFTTKRCHQSKVPPSTPELRRYGMVILFARVACDLRHRLYPLD
jgi:hypothetical protein